MNKLKVPKKLLDKRIPTILGVTVLVVALVAGTLMIGSGGGVFAPRASAETTPKNVKVTNIHDTSFTVSFLTDSEVAGFIKYGTEANSLKSQASDDRDQITGTVGEFQIHHITIRGLQQATTYYYLIGTGSTFDDGGQPFRIKTAARNGAPAAAKTIYGSVTSETGAPAQGAVVYVNVNGAGAMSSQVKASGSWAIPLSNARTTDGNAYATILDQDSVLISVQGSLPSQRASFTTTVERSQPVEGMVFGQNTVDTNTQEFTDETESIRDLATTPVDSFEDDIDDEILDETEEEFELDIDDESTESGETYLLDDLLVDEDSTESDATEVVELDLEIVGHQTITTADPIITGMALPGVTVTIEVHSDTQIEQTLIADADGEFVLDIATLSESLEPGEHSVTYSYTDPDTGEIIEKTVEFTVDDPIEQLADAGDIIDDEELGDPTPYGSGNPYPIDGEASESAEATEEARTSQPATDEGVPVSGSVGTTLTLVFGGLFFIISGLWSLWISTQLEKGELEV